MAEPKTKVNDASVEDFLNSVSHKKRREDSFTVLELMQRVTEEPPEMWGSSIVGFGRQNYKYASGREGEWLMLGFSPRKASLSLYGIKHDERLLNKLGKYKTGKSCLYVNKLEDVDMDVLEELVRASLGHMDAQT